MLAIRSRQLRRWLRFVLQVCTAIIFITFNSVHEPYHTQIFCLICKPDLQVGEISSNSRPFDFGAGFLLVLS